MLLKPLQAGRYDDNSILIQNPDNGKQELFTEEEFEIVKFLKKNEDQTLLALLIPNIGIAKKDHILLCMKVLRKLRRMQIVDVLSIVGRVSASQTATIEIKLEKERLEFQGLKPLAAFLYGVADKALGWMGAMGILIVVGLLSVVGLLMFPFQSLEQVFAQGNFPYLGFFVTQYVVISLSLTLRAFLQGAYIASFSEKVVDPAFGFFMGFFSLRGEVKNVNIAGYQARIQMALLGLLAPLVVLSIAAALVLLGAMNLQFAFFVFSASAFTVLVLACPFLAADGAEVLHVLLLRTELEERVSKDLKEIFAVKGSLSRMMLIAMMATLVWLLVWLDSIRSFWEIISPVVLDHLFAAQTYGERVLPGLLITLLLTLVLFPLFVFAAKFVKDVLLSKRKRIVVDKSKIKESLSFEERMAALEKIPLFASLKDQERLALLNEMQTAFFKHGDYLMHQGELGKEFFVLVRGHASAIFTDSQGKLHFLADLGEGDAFGEIALIDDVPRTASIKSDGGCIALVLQKDGFDRFAVAIGSPERVKTMIRLTSFFRRHPLFSKLGVKEQATLIDSFRFEFITAGDEIVNSDDSFYVIYSGKVRVDTGDDSSETILGPDDCFGYAKGMNAQYFSKEGAGILIVDRKTFQNLIWGKLVERPELFL